MSDRSLRKPGSKTGSDEREGVTKSKRTDRESGTTETDGRVERLHSAAGNQAVQRAVEGTAAGRSAGNQAVQRAVEGTGAGKAAGGSGGRSEGEKTPGPQEAAEAMPYAKLADSAYDDSGAPEGWQRVESFQNGESGFSASLYRSASTDEVVLAFRGTNPLELADWTQANLPNALNEPSKQYRRAIDLAKSVTAEYENVTFTGHSLGGGLASAASMATGREAVTFNPAGPAPEQILEIDPHRLLSAQPEENITSYVVRGDAVNWAQDLVGGQVENHPLGEVTGGTWKVMSSPAQGTRKELPQPSNMIENEWDPTAWGSKILGIKQHGMETVKKSLAELQGAQ